MKLIDALSKIDGMDKLYTQLDDNLWMGGAPQTKAPKLFKHIIDLSEASVYETEANQAVTRIFMLDTDWIDEDNVWMAASLAAHSSLRYPTLVHCVGGVNRSALVCGIALCIKNPEMFGVEAIKLIRKKRAERCLDNKVFADYLKEVVCATYPSLP